MLSYLREKNIHTWLGGLLRHRAESFLARNDFQGPKHILFSVCDHYEPLWGQAEDDVGNRRVQFWLDRYPEMADLFRDADGHQPRHSFFFPGEEYRPFYLDSLGKLAKAGLGEVELHLHHADDNAPNLRRTITDYLQTFAQHGHLSRDGEGRLRYAFIHGNWALANGHPTGRNCGVDEELPLLFETGCYADFTWPAAPDPAQPRIINKIYWPLGELERRRAYDGPFEEARVGRIRNDRLLFIEGPLALSFKRAKVPVRLENGHITGTDPGSPARIKSWVGQNIHVRGRPDWIFVKVYTHAAPEGTAESYLGEGGRMLHEELTSRYNDGERHVLHYVTAREMYNIAMAAMDARSGDPNDYRDYVLPPPPAAG